MPSTAEKLKPAQGDKGYVRRPGPTDVEILESFSRGLISGKQSFEKMAKALQWWPLEYPRPNAEKIAKELIISLTGSRYEVQRVITREGVSKLDNLVKKAILLRPDIDEKLSRELLLSLPKAELTNELIDNMLPAMHEITKRAILSFVMPDETGHIISTKEIETEFNRQSGDSDLKLLFTPRATEQLYEGMEYRDGGDRGEYHRLARAIPRIKLNPRSPKDGSISRGKEGKIKLNDVEYDLFHAGLNRTDLRAYYIIKGNTIIITDIVPGKGARHD